jgi:uncharacterized damage-inducible protein DinB
METADLIRYNHVVRGLYLDTMAKLPWTQVVAPKGLSFDSLRGVFLHLTLVEDRWVNYIIPDRFSLWADPDFESFKDMASLQRYMQDVEGKTEQFLKGLSLEELNRQIAVHGATSPTDAAA